MVLSKCWHTRKQLSFIELKLKLYTNQSINRCIQNIHSMQMLLRKLLLLLSTPRTKCLSYHQPRPSTLIQLTKSKASQSLSCHLEPNEVSPRVWKWEKCRTWRSTPLKCLEERLTQSNRVKKNPNLNQFCLRSSTYMPPSNMLEPGPAYRYTAMLLLGT